jgi:thiol-disulfide isomerase/thioredoxin
MKMKSWISLFAIVAVLFSCDYIDDPIQGGYVPPDTTITKVRKVLLEDYTGHKCPNCPAAAAEAEGLKTIFGKQIVLIAVHAGFFASNSPGFTYDFRTTEGNELNTFFGFTAYPSGMIDRSGYNTQHILNFNAWGSRITDQLDIDPEMYITLTPTINGGNIDVDVEVEVLRELTGNYNLVIVVTEDGIVQPQVNQTPAGTETIPDYVHNHVLRGSFTGTWGQSISTGTVAQGEKINRSHSLALKSEWNEQNMHIVAYVYDVNSYRVLQAEEVKLQ